ncbi:MAG TPA: IS3 family transposase, partial [Enterococcus sp.]|nr:IS3 family transposase [Enterococcus sp.]
FKTLQQNHSACEGFFGRLKNEMFYQRDWKNTTINQFINKLDDYIHWYNNQRIKLSLG